MKKRTLAGLLIFVLVLSVVSISGFAEGEDGGFGMLSLLPPLLAIVLALVTKQVILSLFLGIFAGAIMLNGYNVFDGFLRTLDQYILGSLADSWNAAIIIFTLSIGGMIGIVQKTGGTKAIADWFATKAKSARSAQIATSCLGVAVFFDDYANTLIVGPTMRPLSDKLNVSREKLAYIVDSTAAPVVGLAAVSTWVGYEIGLIKEAYAVILSGMGIEEMPNVFMLFLKSVPFTFYNIFAIVIVFTIALSGRDWGPMLKAERRARTGKVLGDDAKPMLDKTMEQITVPEGIKPKMSSAIVPVLTLLLVSFFGLWYNGWLATDSTLPFFGNFEQIRDYFGNADASVVLIWGAITASIVAGAMAMFNKILTLEETFDSWVEGCKSLLITGIILILAWSIGSVTGEVGTADYLISVVGTSIPLIILPIIVFVISCLVAFSTGTSWGTMAIVIPIAVPMATKLVGADTLVSIEGSYAILAALSAVLSGSIFGDHCSPISDTTIMSSMAAGSDHIDHVKTQIPYAVLGAIVAILAYLFVGLFNYALWSAFVAILLGIVIIVSVVMIFFKKVEEV